MVSVRDLRRSGIPPFDPYIDEVARDANRSLEERIEILAALTRSTTNVFDEMHARFWLSQLVTAKLYRDRID